VSTERGKELVIAIDKTIRDFVGLLNSLLDATEAGNLSLYYDYLFEEGRLGHIVRQVVADYSVGIKGKKLNLTVSIAENLPVVYGIDRERISTAVSVMVENAIVYTPTGGTIEVKVYKENKNVIFKVLCRLQAVLGAILQAVLIKYN